MEVVIPAIGEGDCGYLEWRPISRDQMIEEHARVITAAVSFGLPIPLLAGSN